MKLQERDINIINFITECGGATIEQLQNLFFPSYDMASRRLKKLQESKFLKVAIQPVLGKKVYYVKKVPSFHSLVITDITILLKDQLKHMEREYKIKNNKIDCIFILKTGKILIVEVDIYNRTTEKKIKEVTEALRQTKANFEFWIVCKERRREKLKNIKYIELKDIKSIQLKPNTIVS